MARKTVDDMINEFKDDHIRLYEYSTPENMTKDDYDPKVTTKIGKRIEKNVVEILSTPEGIAKFSELLDDENVIVSAMAAKDLYPLEPSRCIAILEKFADYTYDKFAVRNLINGLRNEEVFFVERLQRLYGDNWRELSREVEREKN